MIHEYPDNPYSERFPVKDPEKLYGRAGLLRSIFYRLISSPSPPPFQLVGLSRIGKSSALNVLWSLTRPRYQAFVQRLDIDPDSLSRFVFVQIDFLALPDNQPSDFWNLIGQRLAEELQERNIPGYEDQQALQTASLATIKQVLLWLKSRQLCVVFLLDEFDRVVLYLPEVLPNLRNLLEEHQRTVTYVTAMRKEWDQYKKYVAESDTISRISPFFTCFASPIYVGLLEQTDDLHKDEAFITEPARKHGVTFNKEDVSFIQHLAGYHPELLRLTCQYLFNERKRNTRKPLIYENVEQQVFREVEPSFNFIFHDLLSEEQQDALTSLISYESESNIHEDVWNKLIGLGLIIQTHTHEYMLFSSLFAHFLKPSKGMTIPIQLWPERRAIRMGDRFGKLSPNEWKIFEYLYMHANRTCTREELVQALSPDISSSTLEITISRLRQKIEQEADKPRIITTVRGRGYRFEMSAFEEVPPPALSGEQVHIQLLEIPQSRYKTPSLQPHTTPNLYNSRPLTKRDRYQLPTLNDAQAESSYKQELVDKIEDLLDGEVTVQSDKVAAFAEAITQMVKDLVRDGVAQHIRKATES